MVHIQAGGLHAPGAPLLSLTIAAAEQGRAGSTRLLCDVQSTGQCGGLRGRGHLL